jgi:ABC-type multidrug transport system ATPase subunit
MNDFIIETNKLTKAFKGQPALQRLDLSVPAGSIFGFLGRNGAGKTTTIKTLMGLLRSDSGTARVFGIPVTDADRSVEIRRRIGFVTEDKERLRSAREKRLENGDDVRAKATRRKRRAGSRI